MNINGELIKGHIGNIVVDSIRGKNLFNINDVLLNYELVGSNGAVTPNNGWYVSNYIEVEPNITYYLTKGNSGGSNCFYDSNKVFISAINNTPNGQITVPNNNNIKYMRFNGLLSQLSNVQFEKGTSATNYAPYQGIGYVSGQNSNGNYIKYDDGTLIQYGMVDKTKFLSTSSLSSVVQNITFYRSSSPSVYLPIPFININYSVHVQVEEGYEQGASRLHTYRIQKGTVSYFEIQLISVEDYISTGKGYTNLIAVDWIAIGRWK